MQLWTRFIIINNVFYLFCKSTILIADPSAWCEQPMLSMSVLFLSLVFLALSAHVDHHGSTTRLLPKWWSKMIMWLARTSTSSSHSLYTIAVCSLESKKEEKRMKKVFTLNKKRAREVIDHHKKKKKEFL